MQKFNIFTYFMISASITSFSLFGMEERPKVAKESQINLYTRARANQQTAGIRDLHEANEANEQEREIRNFTEELARQHEADSADISAKKQEADILKEMNERAKQHEQASKEFFKK